MQAATLRDAPTLLPRINGQTAKRDYGEDSVKRTPLNRTLAKQHPESVFGSPFDIVDELLFTKGEKLGTLNRWRQSILEELSASGEGMRTHGVSSERAGLLSQIEEAKGRLGFGPA
jgi:hypothetical protein